jgi:hypothetical protein
MTNYSWLQHLKAGDEVLVRIPFYWSWVYASSEDEPPTWSEEVLTVERVADDTICVLPPVGTFLGTVLFSRTTGKRTVPAAIQGVEVPYLLPVTPQENTMHDAQEQTRGGGDRRPAMQELIDECQQVEKIACSLVDEIRALRSALFGATGPNVPPEVVSNDPSPAGQVRVLAHVVRTAVQALVTAQKELAAIKREMPHEVAQFNFDGIHPVPTPIVRGSLRGRDPNVNEDRGEW